MKKEIKAYSSIELESLVLEAGHPRFRAKQLTQWLYKHAVSHYDDMKNLPQKMREEFADAHPLFPPALINKQISKDGTRKYVLEYHDGARVETVAIPSLPGGTSSGRLSVCVSTQVGCPMACSFCATGQEGFSRNLLPGEILDQIHLAESDLGIRPSSIVTMGQGEPFLNYENTLAALRFINDPHLYEIGARHITISTCGITRGIEQLSCEPEQFTLAVSLHSAQQEIRDELMPKVASEPLPVLKQSLLTYVSRTNRRVSLEYILSQGVTDTQDALNALLRFCDGLLCHVNLLPINAIEKSDFSPSPNKIQNHWVKTLEKKKIPVTIRNSRGSDIAGACGQLKNSLSAK